VYNVHTRRGRIYTHGSSGFGRHRLTKPLVPSGIDEMHSVIEMNFISGSIMIKELSYMNHNFQDMPFFY
jgi:hypothetical protein